MICVGLCRLDMLLGQLGLILPPLSWVTLWLFSMHSRVRNSKWARLSFIKSYQSKLYVPCLWDRPRFSSIRIGSVKLNHVHVYNSYKINSGRVKSESLLLSFLNTSWRFAWLLYGRFSGRSPILWSHCTVLSFLLLFNSYLIFEALMANISPFRQGLRSCGIEILWERALIYESISWGYL